MSPKAPVKAAKAASRPAVAHTQADLVAALRQLDLSSTVEVCSNAAVHRDLASFLGALCVAANKDAERITRQRIKQTAKQAGVPYPSARIGNVDTSPGRGVVKMELDDLTRCKWVVSCENLLIGGPAQSGKSYLASALASAVLEGGHSVLYRNTTDLLREWHTATLDSPAAFAALRARVRDADLLVLDNFGEGNVFAHDLGYLREIITERFNEEGKSLCVVSTSDKVRWQEWLSHSDEGRAISERIVNAFRKYSLVRGPK